MNCSRNFWLLCYIVRMMYTYDCYNEEFKDTSGFWKPNQWLTFTNLSSDSSWYWQSKILFRILFQLIWMTPEMFFNINLPSVAGKPKHKKKTIGEKLKQSIGRSSILVTIHRRWTGWKVFPGSRPCQFSHYNSWPCAHFLKKILKPRNTLQTQI